ncbi:threonine/serine ThrE exporter family protein [Microbacterium sp. zg.Y909]|uniref:threonine/serine ThrE exporter family protein n=1 Tax=Microbacterium sp. zg.Y909 TaxID=2969413 RepID=UPI00214B59AE|nr:threonine/serine exporter family protein [Microbacterium sp. zg.Y909]MCR2828343.1 threonine/serine exporter family protein [Microbacterium sp. zg.Y909]
MQQRRQRLARSLDTLIRGTESSPALTEALPIIDDALAARMLDLAVRIGETMLVAGAGASEVALTIVRVSGAYGLKPVHVDITYNSITVAHHRSDAARPITLLRVVRGPAPDHERLQRLQRLVADICAGMTLDAAATEFRAIRRAPFRYRPAIVIAAQALLAVGVAVMFGGNWLVIALAFIAAALAAFTQFGLAKAQVPFFFSQIAGAFVLTMVAALSPLLAATGWDEAASVRPSVIVASGIVLMLAGLTVVGAAQDAIDGFALTATGRILELTTQTLGVVLGILAGLETARVVGLGMAPPSDAVPLGPVPLQFLGAALIAVAVAVFNGAGTRIIVISTLLSTVAWFGFLAASAVGFDAAAASGVGAFGGSLLGVVVAYRLHVPSVAITTAAILPLVPGAAVFRGLLSVVESGSDPAVLLTGFGTLAAAATVGISLAVGASLGIYLGQPLRASLTGVARARARLRR